VNPGIAIAESTRRPIFAQIDGAVVFIFLLAFTIATRALFFGSPVAEFDEQLYSLIGWRMTQGELPYVDLWDRKPFGLFALFALAHTIFGLGPIAFQIVGSMFSFAGALLVYALAKPLVDRVTAVIGGALYLLLLAVYGSGSGQSEVFYIPMALAMLWLVRDWHRPDATRRAALAMLIGGLALQIKYTVLPQCLFFGGYALLGEWRREANPARLLVRVTQFAFLGLLPTTLVGIFYFWQGHFEEFWFANFASFFERLSPPNGRFRYELLTGYAPIALLVIPGIYTALRLNPPRDGRTYALYVGWMIATLATVLLPATVYLYYYAAVVPAAVLVSLPAIDVRGPMRFVPAALLLGGAIHLYDVPGRFARSLNDTRAEARLAQAIAPHVGTERDCLYVFDGPTSLYRSTETCLPTRFIYPDHLNNALEEHALGIDQSTELLRILSTRPGVIVTASTAVTPQRPSSLALIEATTRRNYRPLAKETLHDREIVAWVRRDSHRNR